MYRVSKSIRKFALALLTGAAIASLWVNFDAASYYDTIELRLFHLPFPEWIVASHIRVTLISLTSNLLMSLFFLFLGKEMWEAYRLERGALHGTKAGLPVLATLGGLIGAVLVWVLFSALFETADEARFGTGWAVPLGCDVVLGYIVGRAVFGRGHPALHLLMLVLIGADLAGLLALGLAYPAQPLRLVWLLLPLVASLGVWALFGRRAQAGHSERDRQRAQHLWPYFVAGALSWIGVAASGLPGALGLLPIIPAIPHAERSFGLFAEAEALLHDPLNRFTHLLARPLIAVLFLFGLTRGGIDLGAAAPTTWIALAALWIGKPLGIVLGSLLAIRGLRLPFPSGIAERELALVAGIASIGFTVPVLALETALPGGAMAEAARLGFALSLLAGPVLLLVSRLR